jgi:GT2 family glycosyltransferase
MVSVVILSLCPPKKLLDDLKNQTYQDFEIIIASEKGIVNAMNKALDKAKGDIFVRIDDDVELSPTWLIKLIKPFKDKRIAGVTGPTYVPVELRNNRDSIRIANNPNAFVRWLFDNEPFAPAKIYKCGSVSYGSNFIDKMYGSYYPWDECYQIDHLEGTNWAMRTDLIRQVGGFDPKFDGVAEWFDTDVEFKIKKLGYKLIYEPYAGLRHLLNKSTNFNHRHGDFGRIKNWLRFHWRHSKFHPKMIIWLGMMIGYTLWKKFR